MPRRLTAVLVLLVDQPCVTAEDLTRLIGAWVARPRLAVAAEYSGRPGVPAIIPRRYFSALRALSGDTGARGFLRSLENLVCVSMPSAAFDVDVPEDAARLSGSAGRHSFRGRTPRRTVGALESRS
jgi:molybdenum cofactor cytidylyltransferase